MLSPSFQTSLLSKKIKKDLPRLPQRRICSDLLLPRASFNPQSELPSPNVFPDITSPKSAAIIMFRDQEPPNFTKNKLLQCSLVQKDVKEISKLFTRRATNSQKEVFGKIDEIVGKLQQPRTLDFGTQLQELKHLTSTQEQVVMQLVANSPDYKVMELARQIAESKPSFLMQDSKRVLNFEDSIEQDQCKENRPMENMPLENMAMEQMPLENMALKPTMELERQTNSHHLNLHREFENIENMTPTIKKKNEPTINHHFSSEFIENFDFQLNFSSPFKTRGFDKENFRGDLTLERKLWKGKATPGNSTPCTTPLLERKRLLSSAKVEDMTDLSPKRDLVVDFEELLNEFNEAEAEAKKWRCEEKEEWDCVREEKLLE